MTTSDVQRHYSELLAERYTWMFGVSFAAKVADERNLLQSLGVTGGALAYDLGCGPGFQSIALADLGFARVIAIDTCQALLDELNVQKGERNIATVIADIREPLSERADAIVCMGDTLTHLADPASVAKLCINAHKALRDGGVLVLTFRDLTLPPKERFFLVRGDAACVMTCALDYEPATVVVNDLLHVHHDGQWTLRRGSYRKLRLDPERLADDLTRIGYKVEVNGVRGRLHTIVARRT
jgi:SAM-dependent methyltransferase